MFKEFDTAKQGAKEVRSVIQYSLQLQTSSEEEQIQRNRLSEIKEISPKPVLIIAQAGLCLGEDFHVIINWKWKYFNRCELLAIVRSQFLHRGNSHRHPSDIFTAPSEQSV